MDVATIPSTGERFRFLATPEDLVRLEWWLPPGGRSPVHLHPRQVERVTGIEGELCVRYRRRRRGDTFTVGADETLSVPAGIPHAFLNDAGAPAHMLVDFIPALSTKRFFETLAGMAADGRAGTGGRPKRLRDASAVVAEFGEAFRLARPSPWLQGLFGGFARALGTHAHVADYALPIAEPDFDAAGAVARALPVGRP